MNWYSNYIIKTANTLIRSLGLKPESKDFANAQRFEKQLKQDGTWQKVLQTKKQNGPKDALFVFRNKIDEYTSSVESNPPQISTEGKQYTSHLKRTSTGGDWYEFSAEKVSFGPTSASYDFEDLDMLDIDENDIQEKVYEEYVFDALGDIVTDTDVSEDTREEAKEILQQPQDEIEEELEWLWQRFDLKLYTSMSYEEAIDDARSELAEAEKERRIEEHNEEIGIAAEELADLACGGSWCISQLSSHGEDFLREGNSFFVLRRNGDPRVAIRFLTNDASDIAELQFPSNTSDNAKLLDIVDLYQAPYLDFSDVMNHVDLDSEKLKEIIEEPIELEDEFVLRQFGASGAMQDVLQEMYHNDAISLYVNNYDQEKEDPFMKSMFLELKEISSESDAFIESLLEYDNSFYSDPNSAQALRNLGSTIGDAELSEYFTKIMTDGDMTDGDGDIAEKVESIYYLFGDRAKHLSDGYDYTSRIYSLIETASNINNPQSPIAYKQLLFMSTHEANFYNIYNLSNNIAREYAQQEINNINPILQRGMPDLVQNYLDNTIAYKRKNLFNSYGYNVSDIFVRVIFDHVSKYMQQSRQNSQDVQSGEMIAP